MGDRNTSKFISLILRHKPEVIGITLDEHGWANVDELISGVSRTHDLDMEAAKKVGQRHGKPIVYKVKAAAMHEDGYKFFLSVNGVWLTKEVPRQYLVHYAEKK